jgi:hypothetical protein
VFQDATGVRQLAAPFSTAKASCPRNLVRRDQKVRGKDMTSGFWLILTFYILSIFTLRRTKLWRPGFLEPVAMWSMIAAIVLFCQPRSAILFRNAYTILIFGLIYWNIASNMKPGNWELVEGAKA